MKNLLLGFLFLSVVSQLSFAQTVTVTTYGVSPFDVVRDSVEQYFDRPYNGLTNVGKETKLFLQGNSNLALDNPTWTITEKPTGSNATFGSSKDVDTSTQIITFIPDLTGTYRISFQSGTTTGTITINSALFLGVDGGAAGFPTCITCHNNTLFDFVYDKWNQTGHADMLVRGLNGELGSYYNEDCISCHTTGYDPMADNDGFDDFPFVFPTIGPGVYNQMLTQYPDAMKRANIQCESCHGPGSNHYSQMEDSKIATTLSSANCAVCHDDGHYHIFPYQWDVSAHAEGSNFFAGSSRWGCTPCHNGQGFVDKVKGKTQSVTEIIKITCATCHDPHSNELPHQVRSISATLRDGYQFEGGTGALCVNCHQGRREATSYVENFLSSLGSHYGPHYSQQGDMIAGSNAYTWGENVPTSPHLPATANACVDCHMAEGDHSAGIPLSGGHSFSMTSPDGIANVASCEPCHGNVGTTFADKKFYINGTADLDRNGVAEGLQHEIHGLLDQLASLLPPIGVPEVGVIDSSWTLDQAGGSFNYKYIKYDGSYGIHNPHYTVGLLYLSIGKLGGIVSIDDFNGNTPSDYSLDQNYPNPFNPSTMIRFTIPFESNVKIDVYNINGELITELVNGLRASGSHEVSFSTTELKISSGVYLYVINASAIDGSKSFQQTKKMVLIK